MAKKPAHTSIMISDISSFTAGACDSGDGTVFVEMNVPSGNEGAFVDLLHGALRVIDKGGAYDAIKALIRDETRLAALVQEHLARKI